MTVADAPYSVAVGEDAEEVSSPVPLPEPGSGAPHAASRARAARAASDSERSARGEQLQRSASLAAGEPGEGGLQRTDNLKR